MLSSPFATSEGEINVVTNMRLEMIKFAGKTGGIGVSHFERFLGVLG